jgi:hypothetical protein
MSGDNISSDRESLKPDRLLQFAKASSITVDKKAGLLTCNFPDHPSRVWAVDILSQDKYVTYSCATVRDSHTIPY